MPEGYLNIGGTDVSASAAELNLLDGVTSTTAQINKLNAVTGYPVEVAECTFAESGVAGVYTGSVSIPAGAIISNIIVAAVVLWGAGTSATMKVGDVADDDGFFTGVDLKATDLLAGETLSFSQSGGKAGAYNIGTNTHWTTLYSASARVVSGIVTTVGTTSSVGRTRMLVFWAATGAQTAAVKV